MLSLVLVNEYVVLYIIHRLVCESLDFVFENSLRFFVAKMKHDWWY